MKRNTHPAVKRTHQYNAKVTWQSLEWLNSAIGETTGYHAPGHEPEELNEARDLMERAAKLLVKVGRDRDRDGGTDIFAEGWIEDAFGRKY